MKTAAGQGMAKRDEMELYLATLERFQCFAQDLGESFKWHLVRAMCQYMETVMDGEQAVTGRKPKPIRQTKPTEKIYEGGMAHVERETGFSPWRIRKAISSGEELDGYHFEWAAPPDNGDAQAPPPRKRLPAPTPAQAGAPIIVGLDARTVISLLRAIHKDIIVMDDVSAEKVLIWAADASSAYRDLQDVLAGKATLELEDDEVVVVREG